MCVWSNPQTQANIYKCLQWFVCTFLSANKCILQTAHKYRAIQTQHYFEKLMGDGKHQGNKSQLKLINSNETGEAKLHINKNIKTPNSEWELTGKHGRGGYKLKVQGSKKQTYSSFWCPETQSGCYKDSWRKIPDLIPGQILSAKSNMQSYPLWWPPVDKRVVKSSF